MFTYHEESKSTKESISILKEAQTEFGFVPNIVRILSESPATYKAYKKTFEILFHETSLSLIEAQIVLLTVSVQNRCAYDVAAHSWGMKMCKVPADVISAIRNSEQIADSKYEELHSFTVDLVASQGHLDSSRVQQFLNSGFSQKNIFEIITGVAVKTISNLANNLADTELDDSMKEFFWTSQH